LKKIEAVVGAPFGMNRGNLPDPRIIDGRLRLFLLQEQDNRRDDEDGSYDEEEDQYYADQTTTQ
jgi:hypothetical protein